MFISLDRTKYLGVAGFTLVELVFIIIIVALVMVLLTPFIRNIREKAKIVGCEENLYKIGLALMLYASEHNEKLPSSLGELLEGGYLDDEKAFNCPASAHIGDIEDPDYHYTIGYTAMSPSDSIIVFDKDQNHKEGKHVLYISGDIAWQKKQNR